MKKSLFAAVAAWLLVVGCSPEPTGAADIRLALKQARRVHDAPGRIAFLRRAYDGARKLKAESLGSESVTAFLEKYDAQLGRIPADVYQLSIQVRDIEAFKWALDGGVRMDVSRHGLQELWKAGAVWRDYLMAEYPAALPLFMEWAVREHNLRFFDKYAGAFKASGFKTFDPLDATEFNTRFGRFLAVQLEKAVAKKDVGRIAFLLDHTPSQPAVVYVDWKMKETMPKLADYVCHEIKDEGLACKLVALKYDLGRVDWSKAGFGAAFSDALMADPEHAVVHVLDLDEWHGDLSDEEARFLLALPESQMGLLHERHVDKAVETFVRLGETARARQFVEFRETFRPLTRHDYTELVNWALESGNEAFFEYVMGRCDQLSIYSFDLVRLSRSPELFVRFAPQIFRKVYRTMDREPRPDGTTLGRLQDVLLHGNHAAGLYIVKELDLQGIWPQVTEGRTLLMDVCHGGNLEAARYLIERMGADVRAHTGYMKLEVSLFGRSESKEGRLTPMFFAAAGGNSELIRYLASKGAAVNSYSAYGATPLMYAVSNNQLDAVKMLIALRANVNTTMNPSLRNRAEMQGLGAYDDVATAYRRAKKLGNQDVMAVLKAAGARP